jgi:arylsulfatase A-like enzyme
MKGFSDGPGYLDNRAIFKDLFPTIRKHMVEDGMYLHRHYAASVCSPSRKQLIAGRSVWSHVRCPNHIPSTA